MDIEEHTLLTTSRMQEHDHRTSCSSDDLRHSRNMLKKRSFTTCAMSIHPIYLFPTEATKGKKKQGK